MTTGTYNIDISFPSDFTDPSSSNNMSIKFSSGTLSSLTVHENCIDPDCIIYYQIQFSYIPITYNYGSLTADAVGLLPQNSACCFAPMNTYNPSTTQSSIQNMGKIYGNSNFYNGPVLRYIFQVGPLACNVNTSNTNYTYPGFASYPCVDSPCSSSSSSCEQDNESCITNMSINISITLPTTGNTSRIGFGVGMMDTGYGTVSYNLSVTENDLTNTNNNIPSSGCYWAMYPQIDENNMSTNTWNNITSLGLDNNDYYGPNCEVMTWESFSFWNIPYVCCSQYINGGPDNWLIYQYMPFSSTSSPTANSGGVPAEVYTCCCTNQKCGNMSVLETSALCNADCSEDVLDCSGGPYYYC